MLRSRRITCLLFSILFCLSIYLVLWFGFSTRDITDRLPELHLHKQTDWDGETTDELIRRSLSLRQSCRSSPSPFKPSTLRIATLMVHYGKPQPHYEKGIETHRLHTLVHGQQLRILRGALVDALWNKPAYILSTLLTELAKPEDERLDWLFWADRDTIILDQCRPLESFLENIDPKVRILVTNDWNGLNDGVFLLKVDQWNVALFNDIMAYRRFRPDDELKFSEQSAMSTIIKMRHYANGVAEVPQTWFNAYPGSRPAADFDEYEGDPADGLLKNKKYGARRGDFLVHFAGWPERGKLMDEWIGMAKGMENYWETGRIQRDATDEIEGFWAEYKTKDKRD